MTNWQNDVNGLLTLEQHEAAVWADLVVSAAEFDNNPLRANVDYTGTTPLPVMAALDSPRLNRVIVSDGLFNDNDTDINRLCAFYATHKQRNFAVELQPSIVTPNLIHRLSSKGLVDHGNRIAKLVRLTRGPIGSSALRQVRELNVDDREAWIMVSRRAWAAPTLMDPWFGSSFGCSAFRHYGIVEDDQIVAVGGMHIAGDLAWLGFAATHPRYRGRGLQLALITHRVNVAIRSDCRWVHTESFLTNHEITSPTLHNMLRTNFHHVYDRQIFENEPAL